MRLWQEHADPIAVFWTHLAINILSALMLVTCSACMQCLSSPTRSKVGLAHAKYDWLDIGITGQRNLLRVNLWRDLLWVLLALSSIPLSMLCVLVQRQRVGFTVKYLTAMQLQLRCIHIACSK